MQNFSVEVGSSRIMGFVWNYQDNFILWLFFVSQLKHFQIWAEILTMYGFVTVGIPQQTVLADRQKQTNGFSWESLTHVFYNLKTQRRLRISARGRKPLGVDDGEY